MRTIRFCLSPGAPFRLDLTVWALRRRPRNLIDRWDGESYSRILTVAGTPLHLMVRQSTANNRPGIESVYTCVGQSPSDVEVAAAVERLLGLNIDISEFVRLAAGHARLRALVKPFAGFRPPRFPSVFEAAVNAICCQQLSLEAGLELLNRLSSRTGLRFKDGGESFLGPPEPSKLEKLSLADLRKLGFSRNKASALIELAQEFAHDPDWLEELADGDAQSAVDRLMQLKGIGRWSAEYILLRGLGRLSVFPSGDIAAAKSLCRWLGLRRNGKNFGYDEIRARLKRWQPFQGLIYFHLLLANLAARGWLDPRRPAI